jgi:Helicase conserved C-terminal domain
MGPAGGPVEVIRDRPDQRYSVGVLYPRDVPEETTVEGQIVDEMSASFGDADVDDPIALANQWMPSSLGVTFFVIGATRIECRVSGAVYGASTVDGRHVWERRSIASDEAPEVRQLGWGSGDDADQLVLEDRARLRVLARSLGGGALISVTLSNALMAASSDRPDPGECLYQVGLECRAPDGQILEYPRLEFLTADREEEELFLAYRHRRVFAIGHGCSAAWEVDESGGVAVRADLVPYEEVPGVVAGGDAESPILRLGLLADPRADVGPGIEKFISDYGRWISQIRDRSDYPEGLTGARDRIVSRLDRAVERMRLGADLLARDPAAREAFSLANLAMLIQMHRTSAIEAGEVLERLQVDDYLKLNQHRWYPFQLAFVLTLLASLRDANDPDRDLVDLLWFPTGGGKTEAYLFAAAFVIFLRRLEGGERGAGTAVITRYTLRLLTTQQFQRAAALACACEWIRQGSDGRFGKTPIRLGLWVGSEAFPNRYTEAVEWLRQVLDGSSDDVLPLPDCPWCGTELIPLGERDDPSAIGAEATNGSFRLYCPLPSCDFHPGLPVAVVDEDMYNSPPSMVVATVDKFARLAWAEGGGAFFGLGRTAPPDLIIQDEMHLISGPLGTTVGLYESAIAGLLELGGARAKVIASTATIRRANDQSIGVFGRRAALFPPSGLDEEDAYFSRTGAIGDGRLYVGVMSPNHTPSSSLIHTAAALAQAPGTLSLAEASLDAMWTLVIYNNSLRELGKVLTFARDDIPARIQVIEPDESRRRAVPDDTIEELTSNVSSARIPAILERMKARHDQSGALSMLLATNMIQVGIDVPRLGLMLVNGQPKSTSEYIQASSRVGRKRTPGIVVTLFSPSKARDRSHYESFHSYHQALYRYVEPTSVTPFSLPSRNRALAAALVVLIRHGAGLRSNDAATRFDPADPKVDKAVALLLGRIAEVDPLELEASRGHIERLIGEWAQKASEARRDGSRLYYYEAGRSNRRLLRKFGASGDGWDALDSMRSVDRQVKVDVIGGFAGG